MADDYRKVFLSDRYVNYNLLDQSISQHERELQKVAQIQQKVQESSLLRATMIGIGSGVIGAMFGTFMFTINMSNNVMPGEQPRGIRAELAAQYRQFVPYIKGSIKGFAKLGFIYSLFEDIIQKKRATSDIKNALYAGCTTGALLSIKNGPIPAIGGCAGFAAFSGLMEKYQRNR
ncbi:inner mitochondrial membrane translocase, putative [Theileria equi strain WA]|uniref:Mitochondrial import inner membrane translocase subunit TIM22 n=1 Tax=Theileria equi strain WA TaxID=1537102 RepID=L1LC63_THEEQ|nr:inner mitochondrial membrane translocase, putative [Theileria equi strain WA]EKX72835.1 inner mitochondrial membrane translocase, putative [Theileria equi strain WA]|eukprot:XP_004832287.1 inner mitochondrial membrane translocase, putative [Theileria equi strain WA]